jgi:hypothetical protein
VLHGAGFILGMVIIGILSHNADYPTGEAQSAIWSFVWGGFARMGGEFLGYVADELERHADSLEEAQ